MKKSSDRVFHCFGQPARGSQPHHKRIPLLRLTRLARPLAIGQVERLK